MSDVTTIEADVPERYADAVQTRLRRAADEDVVGRIWRKDGTLWAPEGTPEVTNRLGWLDIAERSQASSSRSTRDCSDELLNEGYTDAIVLGMGGSSLAPEVFRLSFGQADTGLTLHVLDSTHPEEVQKYLDKLDLSKTVAIVSSKSGGTIEPMSMYKAFSAQRRRHPLRRRHRPRHEPGDRSRTSRASGARSTATRTSAAATARSAPSASSRPWWRATTSPPCSTARSAPRRSARASRATPACGSASRSASWPRPAATSSRSSPTTR